MFEKDKKTEGKQVNPATLMKLSKTGEVQQLMSMLQEKGSLQEAAKSASSGDATALLAMVKQVMSSTEGADLIENIQQKAKDAGIE